MEYQKLSKIAGWSVFAIAAIIYSMTAEPTGSLWDCGEFIAGAYKFEVVHPPGAPVFLVIGRMFTLMAEIFTDTEAHPEYISYSINFMSGICTAIAAMMVCWITVIFGKIALVGREGTPEGSENIALAGAGLVAGLATAFCSSIWFSAVEGEVYAMSTMFTTLVVWGMAKWYSLPDEKESDRWIIFSIFMAGLSIGVHLLSLLTFPALALLYYFKKYKEHNVLGVLISGVLGVFVMIFIQYFVIVGVPTIWTVFEKFMVNSMGMPKHSGVIPLVLFFGGIVAAGLYYAPKLRMPELQYAAFAFATVLAAFSSIGVIVLRADANTPINMNDPSNAMRLLPYLNREQYGERPIVYGPNFDARPTGTDKEDRYDYVAESGQYEITDVYPSYTYNANEGKHLLFPRISHSDDSKRDAYMSWIGLEYAKDSNGRPLKDDYGRNILLQQPTMLDNIRFFFEYQINWMYIRYFMWNFSGRQNKLQGYESWDKGKGHWITGISFIDKMLTYDASNMPQEFKDDEARNTYFMLPFIFGLIGFFFLFNKSPKEAFFLLSLFLMTGLAIIIYTNQPPNEPRERDYVLVGSFFTYCMGIGLAVLGLRNMLINSVNLDKNLSTYIAIPIILIAPLLMGFQNYDDNNRANHYGARDYASNFLNSVEENAIIFTYGDNDTYPLWFAQEVEGIRTDVRVVNLSLIQVDWYINQLRRKVNDSPAIEFTIPENQLRGKKRQQLILNQQVERMDLKRLVKFMGDDNPVTLSGGGTMESFMPTANAFIPVDTTAWKNSGQVAAHRTNDIVPAMNFKIPGRRIFKGDLALLDILASNFGKRPIYFAVTVRRENIQGLDRYLQLEGLALKLVPIRTQQDAKFSRLGVLGLGDVDLERIHNNVTTRWNWGGFDKHDMFVDDKYSPSVQSMFFSILRGAKTMATKGRNQKAEEMVDQYFEAFPNHNFAFDYSTVDLLNVYAQIGKYEKAKPYLDQIIVNAEENLVFTNALPQRVMDSSQSLEQQRAIYVEAVRRMYQLAATQNDAATVQVLKDKFESYGILRDLIPQSQPKPPTDNPDGGVD